MRVLHILNTGNYSGAENVVATLIRALKDKAECTYASPDGVIRDILTKNSISFSPIKGNRASSKEIKRIIADFKPDIIHAHDYTASITAGLTLTDIPIISHLHNNTPWLKKFCPNSIVYYLSCCRYKQILTVSDSVMNEYIFGGLLKEKTLVVGNPIDIEHIKRLGDIAEDTSASDIIFVGRLSTQKNPLFFLDIVAEIVKDLPLIKVIMVGDGELRQAVHDKIIENNLSHNVSLKGFVKNPFGLIKNSKVMCMPSLWEGFGLAAVEALTFGVPVVASPVGGLVGFIDNSLGGLCITRDEYVAEITKLLLNEDYYARKSKCAIVRSEEMNNIGSYAENIYNVYQKAIGK